MTAQGLLGTARTLQERGSIDLLLASPLPVRLILASRALAIAASSFGSVALLVLPVANVGAVLDGPAWLAAYPALLALSLIGTAVGPGRRHRAVPRVRSAPRAGSIAQLCAALVGGAFLLAAQIAAMLPAAHAHGDRRRRSPSRRLATGVVASTWRLPALAQPSSARPCFAAAILAARARASCARACAPPARRRRTWTQTRRPASLLAVRRRPRAHAAPQGMAPAARATTSVFAQLVAADHLHGAARRRAAARRRQHPARRSRSPRPSSSSPRRSPPRWPGSRCRARTRRS